MLTLVLSFIIAPVVGSGSEPPAPQEIAQMIERSQGLLGEDFSTSVTVEYFDTVPADEIPDTFPERRDVPEERSLLWHYSLDYRIAGDQFSIEYEYRDARFADSESSKKKLYWFDGYGLTHYLGTMGNPEGITITHELGQRETSTFDLLFILIEGRALDRRPSLAELVATSKPIETTVEENRLIYRFATKDVDPGFEQHEIAIALDEPPRLLSWRIQFSRAKPDEPFESGVFSTGDFAITRWTEVEGITMPAEAVYRTFAPDPNAQDGNVLFEGFFTRQEFALVTPEAEEQPELPVPKPGIAVRDERFGLSYTIGESWLFSGDRRYELDDPIVDHPGASYVDLIADKLQSAPSLSGSRLRPDASDVFASDAGETDHARSHPLWFLLFGSGVTLTIAAATGLARNKLKAAGS